MSEPVSIANYRTRFEAEIAAGLLADAGIPYLIQSVGVVPMPGGADLLVLPDHVPDALRALGFPRPEPDNEA